MDSKKWRLIGIVMMVIGLAGALTILLKGEDAMGTTDMVPWGSLIATYLLFAATSVGLTIMASLWYIFQIPAFKAISKRALALAIISIVLGFIAIGLELGNPLNMIWIVLSPNLMSGIWWMGFLYAVYLGFRFITVYNLYKGNDEKVLLFSRLTFFAGVAAVSNLGAVFGNMHARPYWQGVAMPIHFIIVALLSGAALLCLVLYLVQDREGSQSDELLPLMGKIMATTLAVVLFVTTWRMITNLYGGAYGKYEAAMALVAGPLSISFWGLEVGLGLVLPLALLLTKNGFTPKRIFQASIAVLFGLFFMHYNMVIGGQLVPMQVVPGATQVAYYHYLPMWSEIAILVGTIGGAIFLGLWAEEKFPLSKENATGSVDKGQMVAGAK